MARLDAKRLLFIVLAIASFRLVVNVPLSFTLLLEAAILVLSFAFGIYRLLLILLGGKKGLKVDRFEAYLLIIMVCMPVYSAWRAHDVFGQGLVYGILTQRGIWLVGTILLLVYCLRRGTINLLHVQQGLINLAWLWLAYYVLMQVFVDPRLFIESHSNLLGGGLFEITYKFENVPLVFGAFFYFYRGVARRSSRDYFKALPFLLFLVLVLDKRSLTLALMAGMLAVFWIFLGLRSFLKVVSALAFTVFFLFLIMFAAAPDTISSYLDRFSSAITVVVSGQEGDDFSSNARIAETLTALPYIQKNWLLGNGDLSNQWNGGFNGLFGYFYPSDIGILGALFVYGLLALAFLYRQYLFVLPVKKERLTLSHTELVISCYGVIFVLFFQSIIKGDLVFSPAMSLFFIAIIHHAQSGKGWIDNTCNTIVSPCRSIQPPH